VLAIAAFQGVCILKCNYFTAVASASSSFTWYALNHSTTWLRMSGIVTNAYQDDENKTKEQNR